MIKKKHCSSCGHTFIDKDNQGNEGVYCRKCQFGIIRKIVAEYNEAFDLFLDPLEYDVRLKFMKITSNQKRRIVNRLREQEVIIFKIDEIQKSYNANSIRDARPY